MLYIKTKHDEYSVPKKQHKSLIPHVCGKCGSIINKGDMYRKGTYVERTVYGNNFYHQQYFCLNCCSKEEKDYEKRN